MDTEHKKINYINHIEFIEEKTENFEYISNSFQDPYFSFMEMGINRENIRNKNLNDNNNTNDSNYLNENKILTIIIT